jgi:hypothetical protein
MNFVCSCIAYYVNKLDILTKQFCYPHEEKKVPLAAMDKPLDCKNLKNYDVKVEFLEVSLFFARRSQIKGNVIQNGPYAPTFDIMRNAGSSTKERLFFAKQLKFMSKKDENTVATKGEQLKVFMNELKAAYKAAKATFEVVNFQFFTILEH